MAIEGEVSNATGDTDLGEAGPTITLDTNTPAPDDKSGTPAPDANTEVKEPTAEEKAAEETRRAALSDDQRKVEDDAKAAEALKHAPAEYGEFKLPDGVKMSDGILGDLRTYAKSLDLNQEKTQGIVDLGVKLQTTWREQEQKIIADTKTEWANASRTDKEFGGEKLKENLAVAEGAMKEFASPAFRKMLRDSGLGNHPEVIRTFFKLGTAMKADKTIKGGEGDPNAKRDETPEARASRLYPKQAATV